MGARQRRQVPWSSWSPSGARRGQGGAPWSPGSSRHGALAGWLLCALCAVLRHAPQADPSETAEIRPTPQQAAFRPVAESAANEMDPSVVGRPADGGLPAAVCCLQR
jgi:hypothetical protein